MNGRTKIANAKRHTHLQFAPANAKAKNCKRVCLCHRYQQNGKKASLQQSIKIIAEKVVNMNIVARIKFCSKLKNYTSAIGYYSYTNRCTTFDQTNY